MIRPHPYQFFYDQFLEWDSLGRGALPISDIPVVLEPPYARFDGYQIPAVTEIDDGRVPGLFGRLFGKQARINEHVDPPIESLDYDIGFDSRLDGIKAINVSLPSGFQASIDQHGALLSQLSRCTEPLSFEIIADHTSIFTQFTASELDTPVVTGALRSFFPEAIFDQGSDRFVEKIDTADCEAFEVIECGLGREFLIQLSVPKTDALVGFIGALADLAEGQFGMFQILFQPVNRPWSDDMLRVLVREDGNPAPWIEDELLVQAKEKTASPLYAVVIRVCAGSFDTDSMWKLMMRMASPLQLFTAPGKNHFIPLPNRGYDNEEHIEDLYYRRSRRFGMLLSKTELFSLVHLPSNTVKTERFSRQVLRTKGAPKTVLHKPGVRMGENFHHGETKEVFLNNEQRGRHMHIVGSSGTGKSTLIYKMILDDIESGHGVAVLDPHGELIDSLLAAIPDHRIQDVVLLDPSDESASVGFNILSANSETEKILLASDLVAVFERLSQSWGDQMNIILRNAILAFLESPLGGTLSDMRRFLVDVKYRKEYVQTIGDPDIQYYWQNTFETFASKSSVGAVVTRLEDLLAPKPVRYIVAQDKSTLDFSDIMDSGKIFLCRLSQGLIGKANSHLLGSLIVSKIQQTAMSRQRMEQEERRHFWLYLDEFQNFITPSMAEILTEARKYKLGLILAHQNFGQIQRDPEVLQAVMATNIRIVFRVGDSDAKALSFGFSSFETNDLQSLERGAAICRVERADHDFNIYCSLPEFPDQQIGQLRRDMITNVSRSKYGTPRSEIEKQLKAKLGIRSEEPVQSDDDQPSVIIHPPPKQKEPVKEGSESLPGKGGDDHRAIQGRIKKEAHSLGYRAEIEKQMGTSSIDISIENEELAIACEVTITTPKNHEFEKIRKCLEEDFDYVILVCPNARKRKRLKISIFDNFPNDANRIKCISPSDFLETLKGLSTTTRSEHPIPDTAQRYGVNIKRKFNDSVSEPLSESKAIEAIAKLLRGDS